MSREGQPAERDLVARLKEKAYEIARGGLCDHLYSCDCLSKAIEEALLEVRAAALASRAAAQQEPKPGDPFNWRERQLHAQIVQLQATIQHYQRGTQSPTAAEHEDGIAAACRVLEDHDMIEEADALRRKARRLPAAPSAERQE